MRRDFDPAELSDSGPYQMMTATVIPRPIAWVSTVSAAGIANLAPHSFYSVASTSPAIVMFTSVGVKDTLRNIRATGEFVVNFTPEQLLQQVNDTSVDFPPDQDEFAAIGLTPEPSVTVAPPRVAESPVAIECTLHQAIEVGDCTVVMGLVRMFSIDEEVLDLTKPHRPHPRADLLRPLSRLGKAEFGTLGNIIDEPRKNYSDWQSRS